MQNEKTAWTRAEVAAIAEAVRQEMELKASAALQDATASALDSFAVLVEKLEFTNGEPATLEGARIAQEKIAALARMAADRFRELAQPGAPAEGG